MHIPLNVPRLWTAHFAARLLVLAMLIASNSPVGAQSSTFGGTPQHTALYSPPAQPLNTVHWSTSIDLDNTGAFAHYGAPLITASNTVLVPVRTASGFQVSAFEGTTGRLKYTLTTDYIPPTLPTNAWIAAYQPVIALPPSGPRIYYAGAGGTVYYVENPDSDTPSAPVHQCFYTNLASYSANAAAFNTSIVINTPLTADSNGVVFFGFRVQQTAPDPLNTTNSGFARIDPAGNSSYVLANVAAGDNRINRDSHDCAPALSNDGSTLYVAVKGTTAYYCYLLGLDSTTLARKNRVLLRDPRNGNFAGILDDGTASPMVAPDGDVFFGIFSNPDNGSRGFLLHFSPDLQIQKPPSAFGWDYTAAIVPTNMVPSYTGTSPYLLFSKYNNYAGNGDGNGINRIALLDPNATQIDPHPTANNLVEMREVMTVIGCTQDAEYYGASRPYAVREWCINSAAVNPATRSVFAPSEDGRIYRWNLAANSLAEVLTLGAGVGEPYVPTVIGPDGTVFTLNGGKLFALGGLTNVGVALYSSAPDLCNVVAGQPVTFTAIVTNLDSAGPAATGTVTFLDRTYRGLVAVTNILGANVPLTNGIAAVTTSGLIAAGTYPTNCLGNHFIIATYSGDSTFQAGSATLMQKVHAKATTTTLSFSAPAFGAPVTFTATVASSPAGSGTPTGMISFWDGPVLLAQVPLNTNGTASFTTSGPSANSPAISASYSSDSVCASSSTNLVVIPPYLTGLAIRSNGWFYFDFSNLIGAPFTVLGSTDAGFPLSNWDVLGTASEIFPGRFQFNDPAATNNGQRFYRVRSP